MESVFSCIIVSVCLCVNPAVFLPGTGTSDRHTQKHMLLLLSAPAPQPEASVIHTPDLAVCSQLHQSQGDLSSDTAGFLQDGGWVVKHGLLADSEPLHN